MWFSTSLHSLCSCHLSFSFCQATNLEVDLPWITRVQLICSPLFSSLILCSQTGTCAETNIPVRWTQGMPFLSQQSVHIPKTNSTLIIFIILIIFIMLIPSSSARTPASPDHQSVSQFVTTIFSNIISGSNRNTLGITRNQEQQDQQHKQPNNWSQQWWWWQDQISSNHHQPRFDDG